MNPRLIRKLSLTAVLSLSVTVFAACSSGSKSNGGAEEAAPTQSDYTKAVELVNVSTDGTEPLYNELNADFVQNWKSRTGQTVTVRQETGASSEQEQAIIKGDSKADVVTLGIGTDIDAIQAAGVIGEGWQQRYDYNSSPFYTAVAFVVRSGNPKGILEWEDVVKDGVAIVTANPTAYSDARWYYAAPWAYSLDANPDDQEKAKAFVTEFHSRVKTLAKSDADAEKAFLEGNEGDVWVTTEQKALQLAESAGQGKIEIVVPSVTLTVEPIVSVVDRNADGKGIREVANAYTDYLFTEEAQTSAAKFGFRSRFASVAEQHVDKFPEVSLLTVDDNLTGWEDLQQALFSDSGLFKQLPAK